MRQAHSYLAILAFDDIWKVDTQMLSKNPKVKTAAACAVPDFLIVTNHLRISGGYNTRSIEK